MIQADGSLSRDVALLEALAEAAADGISGAGVSQLAIAVGRDKGQVSRALRSMAAEGMVERDEDSRKYHVGWRVFAIAARSSESRLVKVAAPLLTDLAALLSQSVHLCVARGNQAVTLFSQTSSGFRAGWEGRGVPLTCTSAGRALLVDASLAELKGRFSVADFYVGGPNRRIVDAEQLHHEIQTIRRRGYSLVDEEWEPGLVGVSAPVRDFRHLVIAAVNVSARRDDFFDHLEQAGRIVATVAQGITRQLGGATFVSSQGTVLSPS